MSRTGKGVLGGAAALAVVIAIGAYWVLNNLGRLVEDAVETHGPPVTGTEVTLAGAMISIFSGEGTLRGLHVGNPEAYAEDYAFELGRISVAVDVKSVTGDVIHVRSIVVDSPKLIAEFDAAGGSNLKAILDHARRGARRGAASKDASGRPAPKLIIDSFQFLNAEVRAVAPAYGVDERLTLKRIELKNLGAKQGGAAIGDIAEQVLRPVVDAAVQAALQKVVARQRGKLEDQAREALVDKLF